VLSSWFNKVTCVFLEVGADEADLVSHLILPWIGLRHPFLEFYAGSFHDRQSTALELLWRCLCFLPPTQSTLLSLMRRWPLWTLSWWQVCNLTSVSVGLQYWRSEALSSAGFAASCVQRTLWAMGVGASPTNCWIATLTLVYWLCWLLLQGKKELVVQCRREGDSDFSTSALLTNYALIGATKNCLDLQQDLGKYHRWFPTETMIW